MERTKEQDDYFRDCRDEYIRDIILKYESLGTARQPEVVGKLEKAMQLINDIALGSQLCKDNPDYRLPEALCDRFREVNGMIAPLPAPASSVPVPTDGVVELLQQIVTVAPTEGKDLWIATVKARAASELALLTKGRGGV